jgi:hypothetical protein
MSIIRKVGNVATRAFSRVRPTIPQAVKKYKACARSPYFIRQNPKLSMASAGVFWLISGAPKPLWFFTTIFSAYEIIYSGVKIITNKVKPFFQKKPTIPLDKGFIPRTLAVLGVAAAVSLLLEPITITLFAGKAIGSVILIKFLCFVAFIAGLTIMVAGAVKRLIGKRSSVKQLSKLIKSKDDLAELDQELQKQEVPPDIKLQLFRKLEQRGVLV